MSNHLRAAGDSSFLVRRMSLARILFIFLVLLSGCGIPVSRTKIIPKDVAQSPEHLIAMLDLLKPGIIEIRYRDIENGLIFDSPVSVVTTKLGADFISYIIFYEGKVTSLPSKPDHFYQEESTRVYVSDSFGTMFRVGTSRGMGQIGN